MTVRHEVKRQRLLMFINSGRRMPRILWRVDSPNLHVRITVRGWADARRRLEAER